MSFSIVKSAILMNVMEGRGEKRQMIMCEGDGGEIMDKK